MINDLIRGESMIPLSSDIARANAFAIILSFFILCRRARFAQPQLMLVVVFNLLF